LEDPAKLTEYTLPEETVLLDRTGQTELARFGEFKREVVTFEEIPPILLDATTAIEDKTFWENAGFDPLAIIAAGLDSLRGNSRGASTITQQLVRARLLEQDLLQDEDRTYERKLKEIIQSIRVTQQFGGQDDEGKKAIITAYLNQIYYGNQSYGVKAAARSYFGKELAELTPGEAAVLAALPKSPSNFDLVRNAVEQCDVEPAEDATCPADKRHLIVRADTVILERRDQVLELMADDRTPISDGEFTDAEITADIGTDLELAPQAAPRWKAPHFVWAVRDELTLKLCGVDSQTCDLLDNGGLRVTTTVDLDLQTIAERWVKVAALIPHRKDPEAAAKALGFDQYEPWMKNLEDKKGRNGALVAVDYQTGELIAYVGSADYYAGSTRPAFQPQYDVVGQGFRQPGSAFKPFNYAVGIDDGALTAGDMLMDVGTDFGGGFTPNDADNLERGPVRLRQALQFSLNIPAVRAMAVNTPDHVFARAKDFGMTFQRETTDAGLALALGVAETRPIDLVSAYATLANGGRRIPPTTILAVKDRAGKDVADPYMAPEGTQVVSPQAAWIVTDILDENTQRRVNPFWGEFFIEGPEGNRRPATLKTGTNTDAKDLNAYGYIAPPTEVGRQAGSYALAVGAWNGNSDNTPVGEVFSIDISTYVWQGFLQEASAEWEITRFARPDGLTQVAIDPFTGLLPAAGTEGVDEWFIEGTAPEVRLDPSMCGEQVLTVAGHEDKFANWMAADRDWIARAKRGPGTRGGPENTKVAYFYNNSFNPFGRTWGAVVGGDGCGSPGPSPSCFIVPTPDPSGVVPSFEQPSPSGSEVAALPCPTPSPTASPSASASAEPSPTLEITPE
ncbi:MAG: transglycosylase domain-containing protein, partial [Chloroflexi bacterium]|nr:transglycosylase domain-containing protein [Chloroflexota bacterium]